MSMAAWPPGHPFPETQRDTLGDGSPDFPGSSGDRERGKFRPSATPKLTQIAVAGDDGKPVTETLDSLLREVLAELRAIRKGIELQLALTNDEDIDLLLWT